MSSGLKKGLSIYSRPQLIDALIGGWSLVPGKPVVRDYDTSTLFREDCLERIRHLQAEIDADIKELARMRREHAALQRCN